MADQPFGDCLAQVGRSELHNMNMSHIKFRHHQVMKILVVRCAWIDPKKFSMHHNAHMLGAERLTHLVSYIWCGYILMDTNTAHGNFRAHENTYE